jgi:hypothetical protein
VKRASLTVSMFASFSCVPTTPEMIVLHNFNLRGLSSRHSTLLKRASNFKNKERSKYLELS